MKRIGLVPSNMPAFIPPMNATLVAAPFDDPDWLFEVKWDGFRVETIVDAGRVTPLTRGGLDATRYFGSFLEPPTWIAASQAIVDGEVIAVDAAGEPDFARLQSGIKGRATDVSGSSPFLYMVFDLLFIDGRSLLDEPLDERRRLLAEALRPDPRVRFSEHVERDGVAAFAAARKRGLEGIMAKNRRSPYQPGLRTLTWQKIKIRPEQELVVGGWTRGIGPAADLAALLVGVYDDGALRYAGKIGTGFTADKRAELLGILPSLATDEQPFASPPPRSAARNAHWVRPELVIRAEFATWTSDGLVRQAAYKGLDRGKDPLAVRREIARSL
jgi:bifunctional non-homologous end joining protein LigD